MNIKGKGLFFYNFTFFFIKGEEKKKYHPYFKKK